MKRVLRAVLVAIALVFINYSANSQSFNYTSSDGNLGTTYSWIDCSPSAGGTEIQDAEWLQNQGLGDKKDDGYAEISWPFNFQFYDSYYFSGDKMYLCTNGFIRFDGIPDDDATHTYNNSISSYSPNLGEIVSLAMEDAGLTAASSNAYYKTTGSAPNRIFTVELNNLEIRFEDEKYLDVQVSFYETSNKVVIKVGNFDVDNANTTYLGIHSGDNSYKNEWGKLEDITANKWRAYAPPAKVFSAITVTQASTADVFPSDNNEILRLQFDIDGGSGAFDLSYMQIAPFNSDNNDVSNVKLFHTTEPVFSTDHQIGASVTLSGGKYTFSSLGYNMPGGTSYIWVTYDIKNTASGFKVDAKIKKNKITLNGSTYPSGNKSPAGRRKINFFKWDGSESTDWADDDNWSTGNAPTSDDNVFIPAGLSNYPHHLDGDYGECLSLSIESGASLVVENSNENLHVYGDIINNGTLSVTGGYNILLHGEDNVIKGSGTFDSNVKFRLNGTDVKYRLETDLSIYRFDIFGSDDDCILNVNEYNLYCSNRVKNASSSSTINITTGSVKTGGEFINDGDFNCGTGTFYYSGSNSETILNEDYYKLKVKINPGTRTLENVNSNLVSLELFGSGTAELDDDIDVEGNIIIGAGCTLDLNGNSINIEKNWTNNGTAALSGNGVVTFDGKGSSHIEGSTDFYDLTINKSTGDVYSSGTNHITNELTLTKGVVFSSSNTAVIVNAGTTVSGGSVDSYVDGPLRKYGNTDFLFPVGNARKYAPFKLENISASTFVVGEYHKAGHSNASTFNTPLNKVSLNEYWDVSPNPLGASITADLILYWEDGSWSGIGDLSDLRMAHYNGASWDEQSGATTSGNTTSGSITVNNVSSFSPFTFGTIDNTSNPLPIELLSFDANAENGKVYVDWQTATEQDNDYFIVERSKDGINSERIGSVQGAGNSNEVLDYSFVDQNPYSGTSYYRLTQVDYNGQSETFDWVAVNIEKAMDKPSVNIYPNPLSTENLNINFQYFEGQTQMNVFDLSGKLLYQEALYISNAEHTKVFDLNLPKGIYSIQLINKENVVMKRLIVQ